MIGDQFAERVQISNSVKADQMKEFLAEGVIDVGDMVVLTRRGKVRKAPRTARVIIVKEEQRMDSHLGYKYTDIISGFTGRCTGYVQYLTGCNQLLLVTQASATGEVRADWFDEQRLRKEDCERVVLDNGNHTGPDKPAPKHQ